MGELLDHAKREMKLAGLYDKDADYDGMIPESVEALVSAFEGRGHSGGSAELTLEVFNRVIRFKTLTDPTNAPEEWMHISDDRVAGEVWQSTRQSSWFSTDGGKTYYDLDEDGQPVRPTKEAL